MAVGIVIVIVAALGFSNSWWAERNPVASTSQQFNGQSKFSLAGIDYSNKVGRVEVALGSDRPAASALGLPPKGVTTVEYMVPLKVRLVGDGKTISLPYESKFTLETASGRLFEVRFDDDRSYSQLYSEAASLISEMGSSSDQDAFDGSLRATRSASADKAFDAKSEMRSGSLSMDLELSGTPSTVSLTVQIRATH